MFSLPARQVGHRDRELDCRMEGGAVGELAGETAYNHPSSRDRCCISPSELFGLCHSAPFPVLMLPLWCFEVTLLLTTLNYGEEVDVGTGLCCWQ